MKRPSNYDKLPCVTVQGVAAAAVSGWDEIISSLESALPADGVLTIECYAGVNIAALCRVLEDRLQPDLLLCSLDGMKDEAAIDALVAPFSGGDDPVFGRIAPLEMINFFDPERLVEMTDKASDGNGRTVVIGPGASLIHPGDLLIYADLARWEAQMRMRRNEACNLGTSNFDLKWSLQYKHAYFIDWRVCDRLKRSLWNQIDFLLDTNDPKEPKLVAGIALREGLAQTAQRPFRVAPFFDPAPWGGQWMRETCDLDSEADNYGWCFDCVPEENSLLLDFEGVTVEIPSINLVFQEPEKLLGPSVHNRFGAEFPIRFDFLDTIDGGNLSLQVHPMDAYIRDQFGMTYTQDESYYMLDADDSASVFLGLSDQSSPERFEADLKAAQEGLKPFDAAWHTNEWPAKKHDHFLIPAGTVHCSGSGSMVLEISATPYIFTFKLWDWGRLGLDGKPRPINIDRGMQNIAWERKSDWVEENLINRVQVITETDDYTEERTGLHELEFIETRRHWFTGPVQHDTCKTVNVLNLVEGDEAIVESPHNRFEPFTVHYAETFIIPASVGEYTIKPSGTSAGQTCATLKAFVRE
ncbi:MAG: class I mannose-6-phosphate isomerase [Gammaproteobacteria bacterium]